ncbi:hypothetical protein LBMAG56_30540 [Verrucomicrobiota bacterium]|nr:hypothetical protein LBMAG56_30540 [Verrucomicrobiota bacterium]
MANFTEPTMERSTKIRRHALLLIVVALFFVMLFDVPHQIGHYFDSKRHAAEMRLIKETAIITGKLIQYVETTETTPPDSFIGFQRAGVLSELDMKFLTNNAAVFHPFRRDSPTNAIVIELAGTQIVGLRCGFGTWKKNIRGLK